MKLSRLFHFSVLPKKMNDPNVYAFSNTFNLRMIARTRQIYCYWTYWLRMVRTPLHFFFCDRQDEFHEDFCRSGNGIGVMSRLS